MIVKSTVQLAQNLGLKVVAEGVESEETWRELSALGCDEVQGYYLSPPESAEILTDWLHEHARFGTALSELGHRLRAPPGSAAARTASSSHSTFGLSVESSS